MVDVSAQDYTERQVRIKDLEEMRGSARCSSEALQIRSLSWKYCEVRQCTETSQHILQLKRELKKLGNR